ncbi:sensor histidine kinase [Paenibacillus sp. BIC5C1]|uniref:sensor histidine kinase n=1 Tax=Paenibacillus sp. BIC5C1 TaxID=3078263 RepID=UPI0028EE2A43|nr:sensor histidine kinase [Paenibacillus sp. BIC5C1]
MNTISKKANPSRINEETGPIASSRIPIMIWLWLVATATLILQTMSAPLWMPSIFFVLAMLAHTFVYWEVNKLIQRSKWLYLLLQAGLIYGSAMLMPDGMPAVTIGLIPVLIGQSFALFYETAKVVLVAFVLYIVFCAVTLFTRSGTDVALLILLLLMMIVVVVSYAVLFYRQVNARVRTLTFLHELEKAHNKVEELTLTSERQRMARDLHDTLAQGLAGIIMQLEAVDEHMNRGSFPRAHEIVRSSMGQARKTLADARKAIDDLRTKATPAMSFGEAIQEQIQRFQQATGIRVTLEGKAPNLMSKVGMEHMLHILSESLMNVARHAKATSVRITMSEELEMFYLIISDNGKGFSTGRIGKQSGHYGLIGMNERARLIGGNIEIDSGKRGTTIVLRVPVKKEQA